MVLIYGMAAGRADSPIRLVERGIPMQTSLTEAPAASHKRDHQPFESHSSVPIHHLLDLEERHVDV